jgi:hypothetical protein
VGTRGEQHAVQRWTPSALAAALVALSACAGVDPDPVAVESVRTQPETTQRAEQSSRESTANLPSSSEPLSMTTIGAPPRSSEPARPSTPLIDRLPNVSGFTYVPWTDARIDAFMAGPLTPDELDRYVEQFAAADVEYDGHPVGRVELHHLRPEFRSMPNLDDLVLDLLSEYEYTPGPQSTGRLELGSERVLLRSTPTLVAFTWHEDGIVFSVVADGIDPARAGIFVAAVSELQQSGSA